MNELFLLVAGFWGTLQGFRLAHMQTRAISSPCVVGYGTFKKKKKNEHDARHSVRLIGIITNP